MSFIEEQRKTVMEDANTAQEDFLNFLEHLNPSEKHIVVREPLSGELDLDILQKCDFNNIETIFLSPGNITSLKNIPDGILKLECGENLLVDLDELPESVVELDIHKNYLKRLRSLPSTLTHLNVSENRLISLEELPNKLETLYCNENDLKTLNLEGIEHLKVLHCSNNPLLVVEHLPDTLEDFVMENNVSTQVNRVSESAPPEKEDNTIEKRANFSECLYTYFELKKEYIHQLNGMKKQVFRKAKSKKQARLKIAGLKPKCVECNRPVGTIFKNKGRTYIAKCGDETSPCSLDIQLFAGEYDSIHNLLEYYHTSIENIKQRMIVDKLEVLLQYILEEDGVKLFKERMDEFTKERVHFELLKKEYDKFYFNPEIQDKIEQKHKRIKEIQDHIEEIYKTYTGEPSVFRDAMTVYKDELYPEMENLQHIKYQTREIYSEGEDYKIYQLPCTIQQMEYTFGEYPKVIKFRVKQI